MWPSVVASEPVQWLARQSALLDRLSPLSLAVWRCTGQSRVAAYFAFAGLELLLLFWALHRVSRDCYRQELLELTPETVRGLPGMRSGVRVLLSEV